MTRHALRAVLAALAVAGLSGCGGGFRESVGLTTPPPDEFLVVARRPLEMPGATTVLPTPRLGAPSRVEPDPAVEARTALLGADASPAPPTGPTAGEAALVAAAGPSDPRIRQTLDGEASSRGGDGERQFGLDSLFGYEIQQNPAAEAERLEAGEESERLRAEGLPAPVGPEPAEN